MPLKYGSDWQQAYQQLPEKTRPYAGATFPEYGKAPSLGAALTQALSDTITLTDAAAKTVTAAKTDTVTLADAAAKSVVIAKADTATISDAAAKTFGLAETDAITVTDGLSRTWVARTSLADTITISDAITMPATSTTQIEVDRLALMLTLNNF